MEIKLVNRDEITIGGNVVETSLDTCEKDLNELWNNFRYKSFDTVNLESNNGLYGLMWYTQDHRYCYLLGKEIRAKGENLDSLIIKKVPAARYAVVSVPKDMSIVQAWTLFFENVLPKNGYIPDSEHGLYFEYYDNEGYKTCELWTPVIEKKC
ncbi:hypothetical protein Desor_2249 [Desulfosporosinus orientis DSM 765]|uniref:AraC effector-binding domain-containing protein n=1 Tax=Desulfosporosinus orientis (strain ATCC 19365 / DSM 765 / NCIMB 8382 / VKM B-1628 / Singapore I) TaxID=768706 RepID=G7WB70_DESOD|nr:effector binding domain-containing protein [Desulfosporosinus orientis]AET67851.1 hypothetical protein Desor_2249 [Desulfosporosinus orientis DSM 765]